VSAYSGQLETEDTVDAAGPLTHGNMLNNKSVDFFESQFQRQVRDQDYALNPFEILALEYVQGSVLDLGCGLGNLSLEAGRRGHRVLAVDASPTAVARLNKDTQHEGLPVRGIQADIESWTIDESYDTIVVIGLLMFFRHETALRLLTAIQEHVKPGGRAIVNVLIEGTTYLGMFDPDSYCLFRRNELEEQFKGWNILESRYQTFPAPEDTRKDFSTIIAEKPRPKN
jgi:tellurite methyltransferase